jgi:hypothetical protein
VLRDTRLFIWKLPAGAKLRNSNRLHREIFLRCLNEAVDSGDTTAAANETSSLERLTLGLKTYTITVYAKKDLESTVYRRRLLN